MCEKNTLVEYIFEEIKTLTPECQCAISWIIENLDLVKELTSTPMSETFLETHLKLSYEKEDMFTVALLLYQKIRQS